MSATISSEAIGARFAALRAKGRRALVPYVTAGHPDRAASVALLQGLASAGADVIEVGVPFSDPLADGPVIQASSQRALALGTTFDTVLEIIAEAAVPVPIVLFSYLNPLLAAGSDALSRAAEAGAHGVLVTDLPVGADPERERWLGESALAFIRLVAPTTPRERMREIATHGSGFVYLISRLGVTGVRDELPPELPETVARLREVTTLPIAVGFGVATPEQAASVARLADGVVVGSAIVRAAEQGVDAAVRFAASLRASIDAA
ncbi:MAG: tryptophan synthase subunit alpha [Gemmatimonadota bacterium]|nr:tryptophan synthase subunit alpha [Gemmatimonadota bacterium]HEU4990122.1 tryptophan synthase subunit alpha [Gemmatimonadaceae bacterium]